jgi:uncharacterized protein YjbJ (UPF0337 family)
MAAKATIKNKTQETLGQAKEGLGKATGNKKLQASGRKDQRISKMRQFWAKVKSLFTR